MKRVTRGYTGSEAPTRRAVAWVRVAFKAGRVRVHRPWVWLQYDFGDGARTTLFCAALA